MADWAVGRESSLLSPVGCRPLQVVWSVNRWAWFPRLGGPLDRDSRAVHQVKLGAISERVSEMPWERSGRGVRGGRVSAEPKISGTAEPEGREDGD